MKTNRIDFTVNFRTKFGIAIDKRKCHIGEDPEQTFKNAWKSLPKWINKTWDSIEFIQDDKGFHVIHENLIETDFDFAESVEIFNVA